MILPYVVGPPATRTLPVTADMVRAQLGSEPGEETDARMLEVAETALGWVEERCGLSISLGVRELRYAGPAAGAWVPLHVPGFVSGDASSWTAALADGTDLRLGTGTSVLVAGDRRSATINGSLTDGCWPEAWTPAEDPLQDVVLTAELGLAAADFRGAVRQAVLLRASMDYWQTYDPRSLDAVDRLVQGFGAVL